MYWFYKPDNLFSVHQLHPPPRDISVWPTVLVIPCQINTLKTITVFDIVQIIFPQWYVAYKKKIVMAVHKIWVVKV